MFREEITKKIDRSKLLALRNEEDPNRIYKNVLSDMSTLRSELREANDKIAGLEAYVAKLEADNALLTEYAVLPRAV